MLKWIFLAVSLPALLSAQMPLGGMVCRQGKAVHDLNLSEAQQNQITAICKEFSRKVFDLRDASNKAEVELQAAFDESPVDQGKSNNAIEHLTATRKFSRRRESTRTIQRTGNGTHGAFGKPGATRWYKKALAADVTQRAERDVRAHARWLGPIPE
jgi:hypothetical protein